MNCPHVHRRSSVVFLFRLFILLSIWLPLSAQSKDFSSWGKYTQAELISETTVLAPGQVGTLGLRITLVDGWHTYWLNPGDSGSPIRLRFTPSPGLKVRKVLFPIPERELTGPLISFVYKHEVLLPIEVEVDSDVKPGRTLKLDVDAEWLVCEDVCIPAITKLNLDVPIGTLEQVQPGPRFGQFQATRALVPEPRKEFPHFVIKGEVASLKLPEMSNDDMVHEFFPFRASGVTNAVAKVEDGQLLLEKSNVAAVAEDRVGVLVLKSKSTGQLRGWEFGSAGWKFELALPSEGGLLWMLLSAFLGGLILNLMPCVFPILSMKLLSLMKLGKAHAREVREQNLAYVAGVLISFLAIASVLSILRSTGNLVGWGFQLQSPVFLALLTWLFFALSLNLLGVFEIDLLNANWGHKLTRLGGVWGSFFTGVLAVVVASPCTAPFMGVALGFGLSQPVPVLLAIFFMLGLGLAFPYLLFVIFPSWVRVLPRPGPWMKIMKQVMAFPMLATTLWMVWVLAQVRDMNAVIVVLAGCLILGFAFWLALWTRRMARVLLVLTLVAGVGYIYVSSDESVRAGLIEDGVWKAFSDKTLTELKGKNVFIDMTADWCLSCKVNERLVLSDEEVLAQLKAKNVTLLKGDWTQRSEEITRFLNHYNRVGVPFYILFSPKHPEGLILPEVLTKSSFLETINKEIP